MKVTFLHMGYIWLWVFRGFQTAQVDFASGGFTCDGCPNACEVVEIREEGRVIACWGRPLR
jgi:hypothetical protein